MRRLPLILAAVMTALTACVAALLVLRVEGRMDAGVFAALTLAAVLVASAAALAAARTAVAASRRALRALAAQLRSVSGADGACSASSAADEVDELSEAVTVAEQSLRRSNAARDRLERLVAGMSEGILVAGPDGRIESANAAAHAMLGHAPGALIGECVDRVLPAIKAPVKPSAAGLPREATVQKADGSSFSVSYTVSHVLAEAGQIECTVYALQNIDERKKAERRIRYLARIDPLTKLANRMQFQHLLQQAIARAKRSRQYVALLYVDVDRFKDINDTFGHAAGDTSLEILARRIQAELDEGSTPGRLAGDEFAVLVTGPAHMSDFFERISKLAGRLVHAVGKPFKVNGEEIFMTASIGIAVYPRDGDNVIDLFRNADAALYRSKKAGGNSYGYYSSEMNTAAVERLMLKSKLRRAFERDELRLHYQPKYQVGTGRLEGAEALVRWDLPERGLVYPSDFIPLAEETNLILPIGDWVLNRVCADYREWQRVLPSPCRVSVNLSLRQLLQQRFLERVRETFRAHGISPTCLELEITETTLMEDTARTIRILNALYGMGLHLAIDDFGTGYSSLSALQQFPITTLKIDQSFIRDVAIDRDDAAIVATIIQMAHSLKLDVVAEGVESEHQLAFLRRHNCDYVQGHLFGDPVDAAAFAEILVAEAGGTGKYRALFAQG
ncbi:MAG TPA: EAL domain-containing protein [Gammaproteobacteria bacterium]